MQQCLAPTRGRDRGSSDSFHLAILLCPLRPDLTYFVADVLALSIAIEPQHQPLSIPRALFQLEF